MPNETSRIAGALGSEGTGHLQPSPVRKERLPKSKQQLAEEAARVLKEVDKVNCFVKNHGVHPDKFYTLPARRKQKVQPDSNQSSLDRKVGRRKSEELGVTVESPPRKPPRTFTQYPKTEKSRTSIFNVFKKSDAPKAPKRSNLRRSVSDATNLKSSRLSHNGVPPRKRSDSEGEDLPNVKNKKQLSPIIEVAQSNDYFSRGDKDSIEQKNVENPQLKNEKSRSSSVTEKLKEYIDEVDTALFNETGTRVNYTTKVPEIVIIDVDKAEKISRKKDSKLSAGNIGKKIKSFGTKKVKTKRSKTPESEPTSIVKGAIDSLQNKKGQSPTMIHSSQKPVDKLPLTRGFTVDTMVKRLNNDKTSPSPPKTNTMVTPSVGVQHNNNQPFSYTRGQSPERNYRSPEGSRSPDPGSPIIYAHVVCDKSGLNNSSPIKQTVHTAYSNGKKHLPHSDSDEGLGNDEGSGISRGKYDYDKPVTHFGDDFYRPSEHYHNDENPITPKMKNGSAYYNNYKTEHSIFIDSSSRGRGDGMDSKRRESLTEPHENGFNSLKHNVNTSRSDLSARRDLLESRINRRLEEKHFRYSPPSNEPNVHVNNQYASETKYYRHGSSSPVGYTETYVTKSKTDRNGNTQTTKTRTRKDIGDDDGRHYRYPIEPKSLDSQIIDYRSSPENVSRRNELNHDYRYSHTTKYTTKEERQKLSKDREHYRSNPEIIQRNYNYDGYQETYHDSLKREKHETSTPKQRPERKYFDRSDSDRKDRLGDSGIENDFKRNSGDNFRRYRSATQRRDYGNDSEDEGFASSLLIASERQHTEDNINSRKLDLDRGYREDPYRNLEHMDYKVSREYKGRNEYAPRERSIDDGSHYDPRIDKDFDGERSTLKKKVDKKPPKAEKKSSLEKVKQLFSRDSSKKKKEKERAMVPEENLRARYTEYRGSRENLEPKAVKKHASESKTSYEYSNRRRLSTPSPSPTREVQRNGKSESSPGGWFKSIDRLSRKKSKKDNKEILSEEEIAPKPTPTKNLRFFGDTDIESNDSLRHKPAKTHSSITNSNHSERIRSHSNRDLQNISEERQTPEYSTPLKSSNHRSLLNISESERDSKNSRISVKPPISPNHRPKEYHSGHDDRGRRRRNEVSSVESSTEGDSSQQSQRSVVYLHAATVGDIPGPGHLRSGRRAASREELASNGSSNIKPQTKTLSRSFSVLAPWKPRHYKESYDIDYTQYPKVTKNGKYEQKISRNSNSRKDNSSTLKKKANETRRSNQSTSTLNRRSQSKENVSYTLRKSQEDLGKGSNLTLYRKKDKQPKENIRYTKERDDKRISSKSMSVESLGNHHTDHRSRENNRDISRSVSMPRDPEKSAGWFKTNKKSKKSLSTQRL